MAAGTRAQLTEGAGFVRLTKKGRSKQMIRHFREKLAATYSRGAYRTTTIGKTVFDGRVRNGNGSDHSFMATKKKCRMQSEECGMKAFGSGSLRNYKERSPGGGFVENCTQEATGYYNSRVKNR